MTVPVVTQRSYTYWNAGLDVGAYWPKYDVPPAAGIDWEVIVHGGWWYKGSAQDMASYGQRAATKGRACFSLEYRLVPAVRWPANLADIRSGIAWIFNHAALFNLNPLRGFMHGASAGGLLSTIAALDDGRFKGIITSSGITDVGISYHDPNPVAMPNTQNLFGGGTPSSDLAEYSAAQAFHHFRTPPKEAFLVMHAENDTTVNVNMSDTFVKKLTAAGYAYTYKRYTTAEVGIHNPHYLSTIEGNMELVDAWIASH